VVGVSALTVAAVMPLEAQAINEALAQLDHEGFTGDRFTFCVLGDTRPPTVPKPAKILSQNVAEMNLLDPAFIINLGDLIPGGQGAPTLS